MVAVTIEYELQCKAQKPEIPGESYRLYMLYKKILPTGSKNWGGRKLVFSSASLDQLANSLLGTSPKLAHDIRIAGWHMLPGDKKTFVVEKK